MRHLAARLALDVPEDRWPELVKAATFASMRSHADELVPNRTSAIWQSNAEFFHRGTTGQWQTFLDDAGVARYAARVDELTTPALSTWLHQGPITR